MLKYINKKYSFELCNTVRSAPAYTRNFNSDLIKLTAPKKVVGFFYSYRSLMPGLFCSANLGQQNQTSLCHNFLFMCPKFLRLKIWTNINGCGNIVKGLAILPKIAGAVFCVPGN